MYKKGAIMYKEDFKELINNLINIMRKNELMTMTDEKIWSELVSVDPLTNRVLGNMTDEIFWADVSKLNDKQLTKIISDMDWRKMRSWLKNMQDEQFLSLFVKITDKRALDCLLENMNDEKFLVLLDGLDEQKLWNLLCKLESRKDYPESDKLNIFLKRLNAERLRSELDLMSRDEIVNFVGSIDDDNFSRVVRNMTQAKLLKLLDYHELTNDDRFKLIAHMTNEQLRILVQDMSVDQYVDFVRTITRGNY